MCCMCCSALASCMRPASPARSPTRGAPQASVNTGKLLRAVASIPRANRAAARHLLEFLHRVSSMDRNPQVCSEVAAVVVNVEGATECLHTHVVKQALVNWLAKTFQPFVLTPPTPPATASVSTRAPPQSVRPSVIDCLLCPLCMCKLSLHQETHASADGWCKY